MKNILPIIISFSLFLLTPLIVQAAVVINEIMYDLEEGSDGGREWVEIFNNSDATIDLTNWKFYENETNHRLTIIQGAINIPPSGYAVIADKPDKFLIDNPSYSGILFDSTFSLSNSGENLALKDNNLVIIDQVTYNSSWGADGDGNSLQRKDPNGNSNDSSNWGIGNPTPGIINNIGEPEETAPQNSPEAESQSLTANAGQDIIGFVGDEINFKGSSTSADPKDLVFWWNLGDGQTAEGQTVSHSYSYPGTYIVVLVIGDGKQSSQDTLTVEIHPKQITINEFLPSPAGKDIEEEWIEIYNDSDSIIDISNWQLDDQEGGSEPFVFPENTLIAPFNYLVFPRKITKIALNNDTDGVRLLLPQGVVYQEITYEKAPEGQSSSRGPDGFVWSMPTPGLPNIVSPETQEMAYSQPPEPLTTEYPPENYAWYYKNDIETEIQGGWAYLPLRQSDSGNEPNISENEPIEEKEENQQQDKTYGLANIEQTAKRSDYKLILTVIAIIIIASAVGLGLVKFKRRRQQF